MSDEHQNSYMSWLTTYSTIYSLLKIALTMMISMKLVAICTVGASLCMGLMFYCFKKSDPSGGSIEESPRILKIFQKNRTVCVGRFLVDVPAEAQVVYGPAEVPYPLVSYRGSDMEKMIVEKLSELEKDRPHV